MIGWLLIACLLYCGVLVVVWWVCGCCLGCCTDSVVFVLGDWYWCLVCVLVARVLFMFWWGLLFWFIISRILLVVALCVMVLL